MALTGYARDRLGLEPVFAHPVFKEIALRTPLPAAEVVRRCRARGIHPGYPVGRDYEGMDDVLLVALTEKRTAAEVDRLAAVLAEVTA
jgi:glycine dehydrogenase subunit 1